MLGRFEAEYDGRPVNLGRRQERCLLGILLLEANTAVPVERLVAMLWEDSPPASARATIHTYISRLRASLDGTDGGPRLERSGDSYLARTDPRTVDGTAVPRLRGRQLLVRFALPANDTRASRLSIERSRSRPTARPSRYGLRGLAPGRP